MLVMDSDSDENNDIGRGGIKGIYTPRWDPYKNRVYIPHDLSSQKVLDGTGDPSTWRVFTELATNSVIVFGECLYGVVAFPFVLLIGGVLGTARLEYLKRKK